jgi:cytochrome P450
MKLINLAENELKSPKMNSKVQLNFTMALFESLFFGALVVFFVKFFQSVEEHLQKKKVLETITEPKLLPIIGFPLKVYGSRNMLDYILNVTKSFGSPVKHWYGINKVFVVIDTPDDIKDVFNSENALNKADYYKFLHLGKGLFVSDKDLWGKNRKILSRAVNTKLLEVSIPTICEKSEKLVETWSSKVGGGEFDIMESVIDCVLDTMFKTILGTESDKKVRQKYMEIAER